MGARRIDERFPSPCGVKVVGNANKKGLDLCRHMEFPSPCGVKVVGNFYSKVVTAQAAKVSVPLRGKGSRKYLKAKQEAEQTEASFRPLAG